VLFASSSDQFRDGTLTALDSLAVRLLSHPEWHLTIEGYTDNSGTAAKNLLLSQKRARAIQNYLLSKGLPERQLTATGFGQEHPVGDNGTLAGRAANRRVELKLSIEKQ
jgi:outer membrane protein OmpA-like peptidoglycan-associated protein